MPASAFWNPTMPMDTREPSCHLPWPTEALPHKFLRGWRLHYCCPLDPGKGVTSGVSRETDSTWLLWTKIQAIQTTCKNCPPALIRIARFNEAQVFCQYWALQWTHAGREEGCSYEMISHWRSQVIPKNGITWRGE